MYGSTESHMDISSILDALNVLCTCNIDYARSWFENLLHMYELHKLWIIDLIEVECSPQLGRTLTDQEILLSNTCLSQLFWKKQIRCSTVWAPFWPYERFGSLHYQFTCVGMINNLGWHLHGFMHALGPYALNPYLTF